MSLNDREKQENSDWKYNLILVPIFACMSAEFVFIKNRNN